MLGVVAWPAVGKLARAFEFNADEEARWREGALILYQH